MTTSFRECSIINPVIKLRPRLEPILQLKRQALAEKTDVLTHTPHIAKFMNLLSDLKRQLQADGQTDRKTDRQTDRQTDSLSIH